MEALTCMYIFTLTRSQLPSEHSIVGEVILVTIASDETSAGDVGLRIQVFVYGPQDRFLNWRNDGKIETDLRIRKLVIYFQMFGMTIGLLNQICPRHFFESLPITRLSLTSWKKGDEARAGILSTLRSSVFISHYSGRPRSFRLRFCECVLSKYRI